MTRPRMVLVALAQLLLALSVGCATLNVDSYTRVTDFLVVTALVPAAMQGGQPATWTVTWVNGNAPFTIEMNLVGGATSDVPAGTAAVSPFTQEFTMVNPSATDSATYVYTVRVTNSFGLFGEATGTYTVGPALDATPASAAGR